MRARSAIAPRIVAGGIVLFLGPAVAFAAADTSQAPCHEEVSQGLIAIKSAGYSRALEHFERAHGGSDACRAGALAGMAAVYNSRSQGKKALAAARQALALGGAPDVMARAHFAIGRALYHGQRKPKRAVEAAAAFRAAIDLTGGRHQPAIFALTRLYRATGQQAAARALAAEFPDVRVPTFAERKPPPKKQAPKKAPVEEAAVEADEGAGEDVEGAEGEASEVGEGEAEATGEDGSGGGSAGG